MVGDGKHGCSGGWGDLQESECPLDTSTEEHLLVAVEIIPAVEIILAVDNQEIIVTKRCSSYG